MDVFSGGKSAVGVFGGVGGGGGEGQGRGGGRGAQGFGGPALLSLRARGQHCVLFTAGHALHSIKLGCGETAKDILSSA